MANRSVKWVDSGIFIGIESFSLIYISIEIELNREMVILFLYWIDFILQTSLVAWTLYNLRSHFKIFHSICNNLLNAFAVHFY